MRISFFTNLYNISALFRMITLFVIYVSTSYCNAIANINDNIFYFVDLHACEISGDFLETDCKNAFANSREELLDRIKPFDTVKECRAYYYFCLDKKHQNDKIGSSSNSDDGITEYFPQMIGIEIIRLPKDIKSRPILGIDVSDKDLPLVSISTPYKTMNEITAQSNMREESGILSPGMFTHAPKRSYQNKYQKFISF